MLALLILSMGFFLKDDNSEQSSSSLSEHKNEVTDGQVLHDSPTPKRSSTLEHTTSLPGWQPSIDDEPYGIRVDHQHRKRIWTSARDAQFKRSELDGSNIEAIESSFDASYAIKIENSYAEEYLFISDGALYRRLIDQQSAEDVQQKLLSLNGRNVHGLGFDSELGLIYLGDQFGQIALVIELPESDDDVPRPYLIEPE